MAKLSQDSGKHRTTVVRHLKLLRQWGLVFEEERQHEASRWWRLRFDPEQVAERYGIADPSSAKSERHKAQRLAFLESLAGQDGSRMAIEVTSDERIYRDQVTGEVRASYPLRP